jgi:cyclophilin family peptidyl-prolyl cis-trans isomerase
MLLKKFLRSLVENHVAGRRRKSLKRTPGMESLERRTLLTGNVQVQLQGADAVLTGDAADNSVEIVTSGTSLVVRGLNGTTINGGSTAFTLSASSVTFGGRLSANLAGGNDQLTLGSGVTVGGVVRIWGGSGQDTIGIQGSTLNSLLGIDGGSESNSISIQGSTIAGGAILLSSGPALISVDNSTITRGLSVETGNGDDDVVLTSAVINGTTTIHTHSGNDDIVLVDSTLNGSLEVNAGRGDDVAYLDETVISGRARLWMRQGNDSVQIEDSSVSQTSLVGAVLGRDSLEVIGSTGGRLRRLGRPASGVSDQLIETRITDTEDGAIAMAAALRNQFGPALTVQIAADTIAENAGTSATTVTITRAGSTDAALTVNLTSSNTNRAKVPATAVIPAGQTSVTVSIEAVDNTTVDPDATVTITANATGFNAGTDTVVVTSEDAAALTITPPTSTPASTIAENATEAARTFTVTRNTSDLSQPLTVTLTSATTGRLSVPQTVVIPVNASSVTFLATVDNNIVDGNVQVQVSASANGFTTGTSTVTVNDNDTATLSVTAASESISESSTTGVQMTVSRNTVNTTQAVVVTLSSSTNRLTVPNQVTIPAGSSSVTFTATTVPNTIDDGNIAAVISVTSTGFTNGTTTVQVTDDDGPTLSITPASPTFAEDSANAARTLTVTRTNSALTTALTVNLSLASTGRMTLPGNAGTATVTIPANAASATFVVNAIDNNLVDGTGTTLLTVSATGFENVQTQLSVTDNDTPALLVTPATTGVAEDSGSGVQMTVTRNTPNDLTQPLVVTLTPGASGSTRLTTPANVTIPANASSVTFTAQPVNNETIDGNLAVTINATATGFAAGTAAVTVNDDDTTNVTITTQSSTVAETAGTLGGTVSLGNVTSQATTVLLTYESPAVLTGPASVVVPAGQSSVAVTFTVVNNGVADGSVVARVGGGLQNSTTPSFASVTVTDVDTLSLTTNTSSNTTAASNGTLITKEAPFTVTGTTTAGATVAVDADGDGQFDDGTVVADSEGDYSIDVTLTHTTANRGANRLLLKSTSGSNSADTAVNVHLAVGSVMRFETNSGTFDVELLDTAAPLTVANFKNYETSTDYDNMIVHRNFAGQFVQGGDFRVNSGNITTFTKDAAITNEFNPANSNIRGTLSMALIPNQPNSGTSGWFFNVGDNSSLDGAQHTVFGRVIGTGMSVVDAINAIPSRDLRDLYDNTALQNVPLRNPLPAGTQLTGTVSQTTGSSTITGIGTLFTTELQVGSSVQIGSSLYFVTAIASNTQMTVNTTAPGTATNLTVRKNVTPPDADFAIFSNIHEILDSL